jgi:hypothetical protein
MKFEINNRFNGSIIFSIETSSWKLAVEAAIKSGADLRYANLSYADLRYADLSSADLSSADLRYANLRSANLSYANLRSANLSYADLRSADLSSANLSYADLSYADLRYADLSSADLSSADLRYANLSYADLRYANLRYADLIVFQFQMHQAFYTFDGSLRIGCIVLPISEWVETFEEIGRKENYTDEQILMYGQFINMCLEHFKRNNKEK